MENLEYELTPYAGNEVEAYTGFGDADIEFGGENVDFKNEIAGHKPFTVSVINNNATTKRVSFGAALEAVAGTAQLVQGTVSTDLECAGSPKSYNVLKEFIKFNPSRLVALKIQSSNEAQLAQQIFITHSSPFEVAGSRSLSIGSYTTENSFNTKMVTMKNLDLQLDNQTDIAIDIPANTTTTFTLYIGAIYNIAKGLNKRAVVAKKA